MIIQISSLRSNETFPRLISINIVLFCSIFLMKILFECLKMWDNRVYFVVSIQIRCNSYEKNIVAEKGARILHIESHRFLQ